MKRLQYSEPSAYGGHLTITISAKDAISEMKQRLSAKSEKVYPNDKEAYLDFIALHWAIEVGDF